MRAQPAIATLRLCILGTPGSGRFAITNTLLELAKLLPITSLPRAPLGVHITYGNRSAVEIKDREGLYSILPTQRLHSFLTSTTTDASRYSHIEMLAESELLKHCEVWVESISMETERSVLEWQKLFLSTNFVLLVLNAIALLSEQERSFIRGLLLPNFDIERVAVVLSQMHLIPIDKRAAVMGQTQAFFIDCNLQPRIFPYSANDRNVALMTFVQEDLIGQQILLKRAAIQHAVALCLDLLRNEVNSRIDLYASSEANLEALVHACANQDAWLQERIWRAQQKIKVFVNLLVREEFFRMIEEYGNTLREQLSEEVRKLEDPRFIKQHLPGYIEQLWIEFFQLQQVRVRGRVNEQLQEILALMEKDMQKFLRDQTVIAEKLLSTFNSTADRMATYLLPR